MTSDTLWDSLKTCCLHMQRLDLATLCDRRDLEGTRCFFISLATLAGARGPSARYFLSDVISFVIALRRDGRSSAGRFFLADRARLLTDLRLLLITAFRLNFQMQ